MMPIEPVTLTFSAALVMGLLFGAGPCNIACLPYLGPVFVASGGGVRRAWRTVVPFSLGRMAGYALIGLCAGALGLWVQDALAEGWVRWVMGIATMLVALSLLLKQRKGTKDCATAGGSVQVSGIERRPRTPLPGALFLMGAGMALNPCAPLTTVILASATTASALAGLSLGVGFGVGSVMIPSLVFALGVAHFGDQVREHLGRWKGAVEKSCVALLLFMGIATTQGWISP